MSELLAPAGNMEKLKTALYFGADAVYLSGKKFGLRTFAGNFDEDELRMATEIVHSKGKKIYVTLNILAHNVDFEGLKEYLAFLSEIKVDAIIVSDLGIMSFARSTAPDLDIHVSTQANITNKYSADEFIKLGAKRLILARELSIYEIKEIAEFVGGRAEIECFVHGAMCISYSGRCLLSNYLSGRDSNRGACVQACRWKYYISEKKDEVGMEINQDERGTYILNSKDLNLVMHLKELKDAGISSFKIEGRMKSPYYVANVTNAYRRAIDALESGLEADPNLHEELKKSSHRNYTTGFYFGANDKESLEDSLPVSTHEFAAVVVGDTKEGWTLIEMRNRFKVGEFLEVLSPGNTFNCVFKVEEMKDEEGQNLTDAKLVQQKILLKTDLNLKTNDILRVKL